MKILNVKVLLEELCPPGDFLCHNCGKSYYHSTNLIRHRKICQKIIYNETLQGMKNDLTKLEENYGDITNIAEIIKTKLIKLQNIKDNVPIVNNPPETNNTDHLSEVNITNNKYNKQYK